jgi:hypothetical protein
LHDSSESENRENRGKIQRLAALSDSYARYKFDTEYLLVAFFHNSRTLCVYQTFIPGAVSARPAGNPRCAACGASGAQHAPPAPARCRRNRLSHGF